MEIRKNILIKGEKYFIRKLDSEKDLNILQVLCEDCIDYYEMNGGKKEDLVNAAKDLFNDLPPGKELKDKRIIGLFDNENRLIGIIEYIMGFPEVKTWYIGQMMISQKIRENGLGEKFLKEYLKNIQNCDVKKSRLGVLQENVKAYRFWYKMGFETVEIRDNYEIGDKVTKALIMEKVLM